MGHKRLSVLGLVAVMGACLLAGGAAAPEGGGMVGYDCHTEPSQKSRVNFTAPGMVADVLVKDGETVKKGQALIRLDDRGDKHLLESLDLEAKSGLKVEAAKADLEQKKIELARKLKAAEEGGASPSEVDEAKINVVIREIQVKVEELTRAQKELEAKRQAVKVEQMTVVAPFDGVVEKIELEVGETPDQQKAAVTVVQNSPVHVDVAISTKDALKLQMGQELEVRYKDTSDVQKGKVIFLSPVADAGSLTRVVRLEVPNPKGLPSGLWVTVMGPGPVSETALGR